MTTSDKFKLFILKIGLKLISHIPMLILRPTSYTASILLSYLLKRERKIALAQIRFALDATNPSKIFKLSLYSSILTTIEILKLKNSISKNPTINKLEKTYPFNGIEVEGSLILKEVIDLKKGGVCLTGHYGNFELMAAYFSLMGHPMTVVARKANSPVIQEILSNIRSSYGIQVLWRDEPNTARDLIKAIKKNSYICALIDQDTALEGLFSPFFGLEATHPSAPASIAVKFNKPILFWSIRREKNHTHTIKIRRINWEEKYAPHNAQTNPEEITPEKYPDQYTAETYTAERYIIDTYAKLLEETIKNDPTQWVWWHRRWRRRPNIDYQKEPEKLLSSSAYVELIRLSK